MITEMIENSMLTYKYYPIFAEAIQPATGPAENPSQGSAWEFVNEDELACEMSTSLPLPPANSPVPEIDPDDFERVYHWFLS